MADIIIDTRGLSCPEPVLKTKKALTVNKEFEVLADNETAKENILRFCSSAGAKAEVTASGDEWKISVKK